MDTGLLLIRVTIGLLLVGHGAQHALGWFGGYGADGTGGWLEGFGFPHGRRMALLLGWSEMGAGVLFGVGFLVPVAAAAIVGVALGATLTDHAGKGLWIWKGGSEYVLTLGVVSVATAFAGPGAVSVEYLLGWTVAGTAWGIAAAATGLASGLALLGLRPAGADHAAAATTA
jgi:putative oxidoreductase